MLQIVAIASLEQLLVHVELACCARFIQIEINDVICMEHLSSVIGSSTAGWSHTEAFPHSGLNFIVSKTNFVTMVGKCIVHVCVHTVFF